MNWHLPFHSTWSIIYFTFLWYMQIFHDLCYLPFMSYLLYLLVWNLSFQCHFQFNGVHAGSRKAIPFTLSNGSLAATQVTFDFSEYPEFSLQLPQPSAGAYRAYTSTLEWHWWHHQIITGLKIWPVYVRFLTVKQPGLSVVEIQSKQTVDCCLIFSPTQVRFQSNISLNSIQNRF